MTSFTAEREEEKRCELNISGRDRLSLAKYRFCVTINVASHALGRNIFTGPRNG